MRLATVLIVVPVTVVAATFAVANRGWITYDLWPLPYEVELPLFLTLYAGLVVGVAVGGTVAWLSGHRSRRLARQRADEVHRLERRLGEALAKQEPVHAAPRPAAPAAGEQRALVAAGGG